MCPLSLVVSLRFGTNSLFWAEDNCYHKLCRVLIDIYTSLERAITGKKGDKNKKGGGGNAEKNYQDQMSSYNPQTINGSYLSDSDTLSMYESNVSLPGLVSRGESLQSLDRWSRPGSTRSNMSRRRSVTFADGELTLIWIAQFDVSIGHFLRNRKTAVQSIKLSFLPCDKGLLWKYTGFLVIVKHLGRVKNGITKTYTYISLRDRVILNSHPIRLCSAVEVYFLICI